MTHQHQLTFLNEFVIDHRGTDTDNFIEVISTPSAVLSTLTALVVDGDGGTVGRIEEALPFSTANASGFATVSGVDIFSDVSIVLVENFTGAVNDDLDVDDNGIFDFDESPVPAGAVHTVAPWLSIRDAVSAADDGEETFGFVQLSPLTLNDGNGFSVGGASRIPDALAATTDPSEWIRNDFEGQGLPNYPFEVPAQPSTPGTALNTPGAAFEGASNAVLSGIGVTETFAGTSVEEGGNSDSVLLTLDGAAVTGSVTVTITPDGELDLGAGAGVAVTRVFTDNGPQSVDIDAFDDAVTEGPHVGLLMFEITASTDAAYPTGTTATDLPVTILDNEAGGGAPNVVISEIMYNPSSSEPLGEWVEIVNLGTSSVDLTGWFLDDEDPSDWGAIPGGTLGTGTADRIAIIHNDAVTSATFAAEWGVPAGVTVIGVPWGSLANSPSASSEILGLFDSSSALIDEVNFDDANGWPADDGFASIYLTDLASDNNDGANWDLHDVTASPAQVPTPINPTGPTFLTTDEGSPGLVPPIVPGALNISVSPGADGFEEGPIDGRFQVTLSDIDTVATTVSYLISGAATSPSDFAALSGTVTIPAGQTTADIDVSVVDDPDFEGLEDLTVTLDSVTAGTATIVGGPATIAIIDNEPTPSFSAGDIIINEIMKNPNDVFDSDGEYFEVHNTTASPIDLNGWSFIDNDFDGFVVTNGGPLTVAAGGYLVFGLNADTVTNGNVPVDYEYDGAFFTLGNGTDEIVAIDPSLNEIDRVEYSDATFPDDTGASMEFNPTLLGGGDDATQNDDGLNWQNASTLIPGGVADLGTPGFINSSPAPEINVTDNGTNGDDDPDIDTIFDGDVTPFLGDGTDFGALVVGTSDTHTFEIENLGGADLTVSGITTTGANAAEFVAGNFSIALPAVIPAGTSMTFDVVYSPVGVAGARAATVEITSDDADEALYDFALAGSATAALAPEITVESNFEEIVDGDLIAGDNPNDDNTDFGISDVTGGLASETYFIVNDGTADLTVTGISIGGTHAGDFALDAPFAGPVVIPPSGNFNFQVNFDPTATGQRDGIITITNDDADEGTYDYAIVGTGVNAITTGLVINEVDADTPGQDADEFIEIFGPGGQSLDGLSVVLFNGSDDASYDSIDLDGLSIPADGYFVIGSATVPNVDLIEFTTDGIQNGADAVALLVGDGTAYPNDTPVAGVAAANIVDAVVYDTSDGDDAGLLTPLGESTQYNENENGLDDTESNSRVPNGLDASPFVAQAPTPGASNDPGDTVPPTITDVIISGSTWSPTFRGDLGTNGIGLSLPGTSQLTPIPWVNTDTITIEFSEDVQKSTGSDIDATDL